MKCYEKQTVDSGALTPAAITLLEYLVRRQQPLEDKGVFDIDGVIDEMLIEARAARRRFRQIATPALRLTRQRAAMGLLTKNYQFMVNRYAKRQEVPLVEVIDEALQEKEVQSIINRSGMLPSLSNSVRDMIKQSGMFLRVDGETLILVSPEREVKVINDAVSPSKLGDDELLQLVARTWATKGRGLATLIVDPTGKEKALTEISWTNGLAYALVQGEWLFDRDIRNLEDLRSLPIFEGNDGGASAVVGIILAVGAILIAISNCVDDPVLRDVLFGIGIALLILGALVAVAAGVPIEVCRTDPYTGRRECSRI